MQTNPEKPPRRRVLTMLLALVMAASAAQAAAQDWTLDLSRPSAQMSPTAGQEVTYTIQVTNNSTTDTRSLDLGVLWRKPNGDAVTAFNHEVNDLAPGARRSFSETVTLADGGQYHIVAYEAMEGPDPANDLGSWSFNVTKVYPSGATDFINTLSTTITHTPEFPKAEQRHQGVPEHRDLITVTIAITNVSAFKTGPAGPVQIQITNPDETTSSHVVLAQQYNLPELATGDTHTHSFSFRLDLPGTNTLTLRHGAAGNFANHTIQTVPYVTTTLTTPTVTPTQGAPGTQFTLGITYLSWDNIAPSAVKVAVSAWPGQQFAMQKKTASDNNYADGCAYTYTVPGTLPANNHSMCFYAYQSGQEVANTGFITGPSVTDSVPPTMGSGGQQLPDVIVRRSGAVELNGTAADAEGAVDKIEWRVAGGAWQRAVGQENWSFTYSTDVGDQGYQTKDFEARAYDLAGNVTPVSGYWRQRVVWERRHPTILERFATDCTANPPTGRAPSKWAAKPADNGPPLIGEDYIIAFKVKNMSAIDPYTFDFCWKETEVDYEPEHPPWPLEMDRPGYCVGGSVMLQPLETAWICTYWNHDWNWIKEKGAYDFLLDAVFAYIPIAGELEFGLAALDMVCTAGFGVKETTWTTERAEGMPTSVMSNAQSYDVTVEVPDIKKYFFLESLAAGATGCAATGVGTAMGWNPVGWALLASEACMIVTSHVAYYCAWDPDPDFKKEVKLQSIECPEFDEIDDPAQRAYADAALHMAENAIALKEAYVRYVAACEAGNEEMAGKHVRAAAGFATEAATHSAVVTRQMTAAIKSFKTLKPEDRQRALDELEKSGIPEYERDILTKRFGFTAKEIEPWEKMQQKTIPMLFDDPDLAVEASKAVSSHFRTLSQQLKKEAARYKQ